MWRGAWQELEATAQSPCPAIAYVAEYGLIKAVFGL